MHYTLFLIPTGAFGGALALTLAMRRIAVARGLVDVPNERSSHEHPTPRGGGLAIVAACTIAFSTLGMCHELDSALLLALLLGGLAVAAVGFLDDHRPLRARTRIAVHLGAASWALWLFGGLPQLRFGNEVVALGVMGSIVGVLGIVWTLNLYNFMDGVDGIAATEAVFVGLGGAGILLYTGTGGSIPIVALSLASACGGFLVLNWPRAKIFMGDVGSGYVGYVIAVVALAASRVDPTALLVWLVLGGVFFVDATITLVRRLLRGERVYEAHRTHGYQWLARRWKSHRRVTVSVLVLNLMWLLPWALISAVYPRNAPMLVIIALAPLVLLAIVVGSGRPEER